MLRSIAPESVNISAATIDSYRDSTYDRLRQLPMTNTADIMARYGMMPSGGEAWATPQQLAEQFAEWNQELSGGMSSQWKTVLYAGAAGLLALALLKGLQN